MAFEVFEHTADVGVHVTAPTLEQLFAEAGRAVAALIIENPELIEPRQVVRIELEAESLEGLFVDCVVHATFVKVDEQGTEAAATTVVEAKKSEPKEPERPIDFRVNRPFVFLIRDNVTGSVMFMGRVTDPRRGE